MKPGTCKLRAPQSRGLRAEIAIAVSKERPVTSDPAPLGFKLTIDLHHFIEKSTRIQKGLVGSEGN